MLHRLSYSLVSRCLGFLLLAAAGLKLNGLAVDPVGRIGLFTLPAFQIAVVEFELFLAVAFAVLTLLAGITSLIYGSADAALAHFRGERISLYPRLADVGTGAPGEIREGAIEVVNRTDHSIRLIGGTKD